MRTFNSLAVAALALSLLAPASAFAKGHDGIKANAGLSIGKVVSAQVKAELANRKEEVKRFADSVKKAVRKMTVKGTLVTVNGTDLTVKKANGDTVLVHAANAKLVRRFGASMTLADLQANDELEILGTASTTAELTATHIRDLSLQTRNGTFVGTVKSVSATTTAFVLTTNARKDQTIFVNADTKLTINSATTTFSQIAVGNQIRVTGVWNRPNENVTAKTVTITTPLVQTHVTGRVTVDGDSQITVLGDDQKTYVVHLGSSSVVRSNYAKLNKKEIVVGDQLDIWAKAAQGSLSLQAYFIRDLTR